MYADLKFMLSKPRVPQVLCGIGLSLVVLQVSWGVSEYLEEKRLMHDPKAEFSTLVSSVTSPRSSTKFLMTPLFGEYIPDSLDQGNIKRSRSNLKLVGVLFSLHEADSIVTIKFRGSGEGIYHTGERIPGGAVIKRILPTGVLLMRDGVMESLSLPQNKLIFDQPLKPMGEE